MGSTKWKQEHREKGLCYQCTEPVEIPGQRYCAKHREEHKVWVKNHRDRRKAAGLCVTCGQPLALTGRDKTGNVTCVDHAAGPKHRPRPSVGKSTEEAAREHNRSNRSK